MTARPSPTETMVLASSALELTVLPQLGARLHRLRVFGHDLLRTPNDPREHERDPFFWGAYPMLPWCNRLDARPVEVAGRRVDLPSNFRDGSAIHGQAYVAPWDHEPGAHSLSFAGGGDGWPWEYFATMAFEVVGASLRIEQVVYNASASEMPAGVGLHPWFRRPVQVRVPAELVFLSNTDSPPSPRAVDERHDLRRLGEMPPGLDATWAGLSEPLVELYWPHIGVAAELRFEARTAYVTAASPSEVDGIAVEPQTHAPQGLRRLLNGEPGALALLQPSTGGGLGGSIELRIEIKFSQRTKEQQA